jgi:hypothetical protein
MKINKLLILFTILLFIGIFGFNIEKSFAAQCTNTLSGFTCKTTAENNTIPSNTELLEYNTACLDSSRNPMDTSSSTQGIMLPTNKTQINEVYLYFPGHGLPSADPEHVCFSQFTKFCNLVESQQNIAIVTFHRKSDVKKNTNWLKNQESINCFIDEAIRKLQQLGINASRRTSSVAGHSGGGLMVKRAVQATSQPFKRSILFDACYDDQCLDIAKSVNSGNIFAYYNTRGGREEAGSKKAKDEAPKKVKLVEVSQEHSEIPQACFLENLTGDLCTSGTIIDGDPNFESGPTIPSQLPTTQPGAGGDYIPPTSGGVAPTVPNGIAGTPLPLELPDIKIEIPGFDSKNFSNFSIGEEDGVAYAKLPFIGEYIGAVYKYAVAVAGILAVIMIIIGGLQWLSSGGNTDMISSAKKRILGAIIGLLLAVGSYTILYNINPELVNFKHLQVQYAFKIQPIGAPDDESYRLPGGQSVGNIQPSIDANRMLIVEDPNNFCFPLAKDGYTGSSQNWGQNRSVGGYLGRCHAGVDLTTDGKNYKGTVISMTNGVVIRTTHKFTPCKDGKTGRTNPNTSEYVGSVYVYDLDHKLTYIYGEINNGDMYVKKGDPVKIGQPLGIASKCQMLHLEVYRGEGRKLGKRMEFKGKMVENPGWYVYDYFKLPELKRGKNVCRDNPEYMKILDHLDSTLTDPTQFLELIKNNDCSNGVPSNIGNNTIGSGNLDQLFQAYASCYSMDWRLLKQFAHAESRLKINARSGSHLGLFQVANKYCIDGIKWAKLTSDIEGAVPGLYPQSLGVAGDCSEGHRIKPEPNTAISASYLSYMIKRINKFCPNVTAFDKLVLLYAGHNNGIGVLENTLMKQNKCTSNQVKEALRARSAKALEKYEYGVRHIASQIHTQMTPNLRVQVNNATCPKITGTKVY